MAREYKREMHSLEVSKQTGGTPTEDGSTYVIPDTRTLRILRFSGGHEHSTKETRIELLWGSAVIAVGYGGMFQVGIDSDFVGDGTTAITIKHVNGDPSNLHMSGWWEGILL
jgi:hypothetical protein